MVSGRWGRPWPGILLPWHWSNPFERERGVTEVKVEESAEAVKTQERKDTSWAEENYNKTEKSVETEYLLIY